MSQKGTIRSFYYPKLKIVLAESAQIGSRNKKAIILVRLLFITRTKSLAKAVK